MDTAPQSSQDSKAIAGWLSGDRTHWEAKTKKELFFEIAIY